MADSGEHGNEPLGSIKVAIPWPYCVTIISNKDGHEHWNQSIHSPFLELAKDQKQFCEYFDKVHFSDICLLSKLK
jgi:hypothetical protein